MNKTETNITAKPGYKKTKLGWIPEEWELLQFKNVFDFVKSYSFSRNDLTFNSTEGEVYYIHYGDIHSKFKSLILNLNNDNSEEIPLLKLTAQPNGDLVYLKEGDLVIADASEDYEGVAACIEIGGVAESKMVIAGTHTFVARDKAGKTANKFRPYILKNWPVAKQLMKIATGISVYGISKTNLSKVKVPIPPLPEQKKIAEILSTWDEAIQKTESLIQKKEQLKRGLMQQLLTGKKRFDGFEGEWKLKSIKSFSRVVTGSTPRTNNPKFYKGDYLFVSPSDMGDVKYIVETEKTLTKEGFEEGRMIPKGATLFVSIGSTIGKTAIAGSDLTTN